MPAALKHFVFSLVFIITITASKAQYQMNISETEHPAFYSVKTIYYSLGSSKIPIKLTQYGEKDDLVFLSLHDDEKTSAEATKIFLERAGGLMIEIENNKKRNLRFKIGNIFFSVDPNRIFSLDGAATS